jgi:hypothetical protein
MGGDWVEQAETWTIVQPVMEAGFISFSITILKVDFIFIYCKEKQGLVSCLSGVKINSL